MAYPVYSTTDVVIPVYLSVRGLAAVSVLFIIGGYVLGQRSAQPKEAYGKVSGRIEYLGKTYGEMPTYNKGDFRYLKVDTYPYVFEIYEPNHQPTPQQLDDLKVGEQVDIYCYETDHTLETGVNRFVQFVDHQGKPYFIRNAFQQQVGYFISGLGIFIILGSLILWKLKKLSW